MAQTLQTTILINAELGNGFSKVGATLTELGSLASSMSDKLIDFGKESVDVYRNYEKSMKDAEVALSTTYGRNTSELSGVMKNLDASATEWAATTIFHTDDVADAISNAAHAGWDFNQIMTGIPAAMELAQAGSIDLSDAVDYIVKSANAFGIEFDKDGDNLKNFIDLWTYAANSSASTVEEFGDAMLKMGSTMRFASDPEELMTLIAVTANAGQTGEAAGTLIRNSILRIVAPTKKATKAMGELGATSDEAAELMNDQALAAANARLEQAGFSAYDEQGNLKSILDVYRELYLALGNIAGGFDNIDKNKDALRILSSIFPTRTVTEALTLIRSASENYEGLYDKMKEGAANGYGEYAAKTMMNTLNGKIETFKSKMERLKQLVGKQLAPQLEEVMEGVGGIVDRVSEMDDGKFGSLVSGLEVVAASGPALLAAGSAARMIGMLFTPTSAIGAGATVALAAAAALSNLSESDFESKFGNMELDTSSISSFASEVTQQFDSAMEPVNQFKQAVNDSVTAYEQASQTFKSKLTTFVITGATLTPEDKKQLMSLGTEMYTNVMTGVQNSTAESLSYFSYLFGGDEQAVGNSTYQEIAKTFGKSYEDSVAAVETASQNLRDAMSSAFEDGKVNQEELEKIQSYMDDYNRVVAECAQRAAEKQSQINLLKTLNKYQNLGLDSVQKGADEIAGQRSKAAEQLDDEYYTQVAQLEYNNEKQGVSSAKTERQKEEIRRQYEKDRAVKLSGYDTGLMNLYNTAIRGSELGDAYKGLESLAQKVMSGELSTDAAYKQYKSTYGTNANAGEADLGHNNIRTQISEYMADEIKNLGGYDSIQSSIKALQEAGDTESASRLMTLYTMQQLNDNFTNTGKAYKNLIGKDTHLTGADRYLNTNNGNGLFSGKSDWESTYSTYHQNESGNNTSSQNAAQSQYDLSYDWANPLPTVNPNVSVQSAPTIDTANIAADIQSQVDGTTVKLNPQIDTSTIEQQPAIPVNIMPKTDGGSAVEQLQQQGVKVDVDGDVQKLSATIDGEDGQNLMEYVDGDATDLQMAVQSEDGKTLIERVTGNASDLARIINSYNGTTIRVNIVGHRLFANGGRATTASIFGEAGPEWAIPEEHSERTADLLNAARKASGFTWSDLLARYGGFNANPSNTATTLVYSPVIHANDATGVEQALIADKERLDKWYAHRKMRDEVEVYA
ncbi:phage tail tape measure protein [Porcincola intestinalis]|uniref:Phage tail tape measure protein n=1 Tax=Porcincola intestinalis TaxID=2606632 RepID=A0A6L5XCA1_9FIRM|nr:phage tail tape measure protein [Porcincola intestinalis]MSS16102.1 phage tail tape measure protein [Porcincola intestinalis]